MALKVHGVAPMVMLLAWSKLYAWLLKKPPLGGCSTSRTRAQRSERSESMFDAQQCHQGLQGLSPGRGSSRAEQLRPGDATSGDSSASLRRGEGAAGEFLLSARGVVSRLATMES